MKNGLPEGYTRLEYLQSTGVQYIDTGYKPNNNTEYEVRGYMSPSGVFGVARWSGDPQYDTFGAHSIAANALDYYGRYSNNKYLEITSDIFNKPIIWKHTKDSIVIKGLDNTTYVNQPIVTDSFQSTYNMWVFGFNNIGTLLSRSVGCKINAFKIWDNDTLIRDFIPALDPSDKPCMYDLVTKQPFYNLGTGADFSIGKKLTPVEYIENTGNSHINTGYNPNSTTRVEAKFKMNETPTAFRWLFLSRNESVAGSGFGFGCITNGFISSEFNDRQTSTAKLTTNTYYVIDKNRNICNFNSSTLTNVDSTFTVNYPLTIFALNNAGSITSGVNPLANCYYFKIYDNDVLVRDFIPVRDENNVGYLLDLLTNTLYGNAGSGSFAIGEDDLFVRNIGKIKFFKQTTRKVPRGFQEVEYLESNSTGTQYIDTGYTINTATDEVIFNFQLISTDKYMWLMGEHDNGARFGVGSGDGSNLRNIAYGVSTYKVNDTEVYNSIHYLVANSNGVYLNGTQVHAFENFSSSSTIYLFNLNISGGGNPANGKIFKFTHKRNGVLIRDFIPGLDRNGRPCLFDKVSQTVFYNQGTGEFTYGRKIIPVEYLESNGTQYINTGYAFQDNFSWEVTFDGITKGSTLFGGRTSSIRTAILYQKSATQGVQTTCPIAGMTGDQTPFQLADLSTGKHTVKMSVASNKGSVWVDGSQVYNEQAFTGTYISGTTQALFADNFGSSVSEYTSSKVYNLKMWQGLTLVRDFIPCIDENNTPYMFDRVTHSAFLNQGTGDFLYGNPVGQRTETLRIIPTIRHLPLNYLESTGTQYVDTGIVAKSGLSTKLVLEYTALSGTSISMLDARSGNNRFYLCHCGNVSGYWFYYGYGGAVQTSFTPVVDTKYTVETSLAVGSQTMKVDGTTISTGSSSTEYDLGINLYLFGINYGTPQYLANAKVYSCKIWDSTTLVRDLIPVLKLPDMTPCFYDRVSKTYLYNESTDPFLYG